MITKKELGYINDWANRVPYPGVAYCEEAFDKLESCFKLYQDEYANIKYNISFSDNSEIEFQILQKNICHMLGVNYKNLITDYFKPFRKEILNYDPEASISSYELLQRVMEHKDEIMDYEKNNSKAINYYKISIKCDIFKKLANLSNFNYGCINFNKDRFIENNPMTKFTSNSTKFLYTPSDEIVSPYFMMGLRVDNYNTNQPPEEKTDDELELNEHNDNYIVETLIAPEDANKLFKDQEVVIPTQILTDKKGILDKKEATPSEKLELLKEYQYIINKYRIDNRVNIYGDYQSLLMSEERKHSTRLVK